MSAPDAVEEGGDGAERWLGVPGAVDGEEGIEIKLFIREFYFLQAGESVGEDDHGLVGCDAAGGQVAADLGVDAVMGEHRVGGSDGGERWVFVLAQRRRGAERGVGRI